MTTPGYPDYFEIENERKRRQKQEIEGGRQATFRAMARGLVDRLQADYGLKNTEVILDCSNPDPREWTVTVAMPDHPAVGVTENFFDFPSKELTAKLMLLGII